MTSHTFMLLFLGEGLVGCTSKITVNFISMFADLIIADSISTMIALLKRQSDRFDKLVTNAIIIQLCKY